MINPSLQTLRSRFAYGSIGWIGWPLSDVAKELSHIGITGIEGLGLTEIMPEDEEFYTVLATLGMKFVGSYFGASLVQKERRSIEVSNFTVTARQVSAWGGGVIAMGAGRVYPEASGADQMAYWQNLIEGVREFADIAREHGIRIGVHPHDHTQIYDHEQITKFLDETASISTSVGLTFDTAHIAAAGMDIIAAWREFSSRVYHVHLKDLKLGTFCEIGAGSLDLQGFLKELAKSSYTGWVTIELDASHNPKASATRSWNKIREWL